MNTNWMVDWKDGLLLTADHMTTLESALQNNALNLVRAIQPYYWGVKQLVIDSSAIQQGVFRVEQLDCILKNGFSIYLDEPIEIQLDDQLSEHDIYIGYDQTNTQTMNSDSNITLTKAKPKLHCGHDSDSAALFIAKCTSTLDRFESVDTFIPSLLTLEHPVLERHLSKLHRALKSYDSDLQLTEQLAYLSSNRNTHPIKLYEFLIQVKAHLKLNTKIPHYKHHDLSESIVAFINEILAFITTNNRPGPIKLDYKDNYWVHNFDNDILHDEEVFIGIQSPHHVSIDIESIKITSESALKHVIKYATNGIKVIVYPIGNNFSSYDFSYVFQLDHHSQHFHKMVNDQSIAIYLPHQLHDIEIYLWIN